MAKPSRKWSSLSPSYKSRLRRAGVTPQAYNAGRVDLRRARGHSSTPERPERAFNRPDKYGDYLRRRVEAGKPVPDNILPKPPPRGGAPIRRRPNPKSVAEIGDSIGWPGRNNLQVHIIWRTKGGAVNHNTNADEATRLSIDTGPDVAETETVYPYDEADFKDLIKMVRDRGFIARVESGQYEWVLNA